MSTRRPIFFRALATCAVASMTLGTVPAYATAPNFSIVAADEQNSSTLKIATSGFVDSFNPFTSIYLLPTDTIRYMYEYLVQYFRQKTVAPLVGSQNRGRRARMAKPGLTICAMVSSGQTMNL